jgi:predicted aldo/keto reductase-like oxidoreductase
MMWPQIFDNSYSNDLPAHPDRRDFLCKTAVFCAGLTLSQKQVATGAPEVNPPAIPRRPLGKTGVQVSAIGLGGFSLAHAPTDGEAIEIVHEALDAGINLFETAWEYKDGQSEPLLGQALAGQRDKVVLVSQVCTHGRDKAVAMQQLEDSLTRLKTDHLDVWLIHECVYWNDPDRHFAKGGVIEALDEAKKQGKVRAVGFSGHKDPRIHLAMLSHDYPFDVVLLPLNPFDATYRSFERQVLPELAKRGIAAIGVKSLCGDASPVLQGDIQAQESIRYAMSLPVAATLTGVDSLAVLHQNLAIARGFEPLTGTQMQALRDRCAPLAADGHLELYKSTMKFEMKVGREQHGFPTRNELPL